MRVIGRSCARALALLALACGAVTAHADVTVSVAATSNLHRAGGNAPALPGSNARRVDLDPADAGAVLRFLDVGGTTDCDGAGSACAPTGADGTFDGNVFAPEVGAIAGIAYRGADSLPLLGVLLGPDLSHALPDPLNFRDAETFAWLAPELGQPFWIGDGRTGTGGGAPHEIVIPGGATRLFLGFHAPTIASATGSLSVRVVVPEPGAGALAAGAIAALAAAARGVPYARQRRGTHRCDSRSDRTRRRPCSSASPSPEPPRRRAPSAT